MSAVLAWGGRLRGKIDESERNEDYLEFHREGGLWKMFGDEDFKKAKP